MADLRRFGRPDEVAVETNGAVGGDVDSGDADVDLFARVNGISPADARCTLQARRTRGRRPSCATTVSVQAP